MNPQPIAQSETLDAARHLLREGFLPLPIVPNRKIPLEKKWTTAPIPTDADLKRWFGATSKNNIGIRTGDRSGIAVIDIDPRHSGDESWDALIAKYGSISDTPIAMTPSGGMHIYFALPNGISVGNSVCKLGPGVDVRGNGGQVLCAPSVIDGKAYQWDGGEPPTRAALAEIPEWLRLLIIEQRRVERCDKKDLGEPVRNVVYATGGRNDALFRLGASLRARGMDHEGILVALHTENHAHCTPPLDAHEVDVIAESVMRYEPTPQFGQDEWKLGAHIKQSGHWKGTMTNVNLILENDPRFTGKIRRNLLTDAITIEGPQPWRAGVGDVGDSDYARFRSWLSNRVRSGYSIDEPGDQAVRDAFAQHADDHPFHPIKGWLESLQWDGFARLDTMLSDAWGIEDNEYHRFVSRVILIGSVRRVMDPGCKMDYMPILQGEQGIKKSMFFAKLFDPWFAEKTVMSFDGADAAMEVARTWCLEVAELNAFTRSDVNSIKGFLTRQIDHYRPPYGRAIVTRPRTALIVGTTNDDLFLRDQTGNRRFLPVKVLQPYDSAALAERELLFAEAMARREEALEPNDAITEEARARQESVLQQDPWEEDIQNYLLDQLEQPVRIHEILSQALKIDPGRKTKADANRVGEILRRLGWARYRQRLGAELFWQWKKKN